MFLPNWTHDLKNTDQGVSPTTNCFHLIVNEMCYSVLLINAITHNICFKPEKNM